MVDPNRMRWLISILCLMVSMMPSGTLTASGQGDQAAVIIPPELQALMAGWEDNFGQIRTLQANARSRIEDARFLACKDLDNNRQDIPIQRTKKGLRQ